MQFVSTKISNGLNISQSSTNLRHNNWRKNNIKNAISIVLSYRGCAGSQFEKFYSNSLDNK